MDWTEEQREEWLKKVNLPMEVYNEIKSYSKGLNSKSEYWDFWNNNTTMFSKYWAPNYAITAQQVQDIFFDVM